MAFVLEEDQNKQQNAGAAPSNTLTTQPTTGGGGGAAGSPTGTMAPATPNQGFANINQYLAANQGQAPQVAGNIASNLGTQYGKLTGDINNAVQGANQAVTAGTVPLNQSVIDQAVQNPAQFVSDPNNLSAWNAQKNAAYTGPQNFETSPTYGTAVNAATKGANTYQLGQSPGGYAQLLNQIEKNPTAGKSALDLGLIQSDPNAGTQIKSALQPFGGLQDLIKSSSADINAKAKQAADTTAATAAATKSATEQPIQNLQNDVTKQVNDALAKRDTYNQQVQTYGADVNPYQTLAQRFVDQYGGSNPFAPTASANPMINAPTAESVATPEQFANAAALAQLSGQNINALNPAMANQAGTFQVPLVPTPIAQFESQGPGQHIIPIAQQASNAVANELIKNLQSQNPEHENADLNAQRIQQYKDLAANHNLQQLVNDTKGVANFQISPQLQALLDQYNKLPGVGQGINPIS